MTGLGLRFSELELCGQVINRGKDICSSFLLCFEESLFHQPEQVHSSSLVDDAVRVHVPANRIVRVGVSQGMLQKFHLTMIQTPDRAHL